MRHGNAVLTRTYRHLLKKCVGLLCCQSPSLLVLLLSYMTHGPYKWPTHRAVEFDRNPALRYLICKRSPLLEEDICSVVDAYLGGRDYYLPSPVLPQSVLEAARLGCRFPVSLENPLAGLCCGQLLHGLGHSDTSAQAS